MKLSRPMRARLRLVGQRDVRIPASVRGGDIGLAIVGHAGWRYAVDAAPRPEDERGAYIHGVYRGASRRTSEALARRGLVRYANGRAFITAAGRQQLRDDAEVP